MILPGEDVSVKLNSQKQHSHKYRTETSLGRANIVNTKRHSKYLAKDFTHTVSQRTVCCSGSNSTSKSDKYCSKWFVSPLSEVNGMDDHCSTMFLAPITTRLFLQRYLLRGGRTQHGCRLNCLRPIERVRSAEDLKEVVVGFGSRGTVHRQLHHGGVGPTRLDLSVVLVAALKNEARLVGTRALHEFPRNIPAAISALLEKSRSPDEHSGHLSITYA